MKPQTTIRQSGNSTHLFSMVYFDCNALLISNIYLGNLETSNMDFDIEHLARKRLVPILNRLNWRNWFQLFKLHIIG